MLTRGSRIGFPFMGAFGIISSRRLDPARSAVIRTPYHIHPNREHIKPEDGLTQSVMKEAEADHNDDGRQQGPLVLVEEHEGYAPGDISCQHAHDQAAIRSQVYPRVVRLLA